MHYSTHTVCFRLYVWLERFWRMWFDSTHASGKNQSILIRFMIQLSRLQVWRRLMCWLMTEDWCAVSPLQTDGGQGEYGADGRHRLDVVHAQTQHRAQRPGEREQLGDLRTHADRRVRAVATQCQGKQLGVRSSKTWLRRQTRSYQK